MSTADNERGFTRLERALALYEGYMANPDRPSVESFLARHAEIRDLLEPMLAADSDGEGAGDEADAVREPGGDHQDNPNPDRAIPKAGVAGIGLPEPDALAVGTTIGPYRIVRRLGAGGFGVVYLAEQDQPIRRPVALKVVKRGMDTAQVVARFAWERQALALMNHPGIATVHDAGATPDGRPYFVMEYVDGVPVTDYSRDHALDLARRIQLFQAVCDAVQHAHQRGVLHRDLKPSNVLVAERDGHASVRVIDFGIAKAIQPDPAGEGPLTLESQAIGTPDYMSPEQVNAEPDIDTRTDVYSLGVILYELLTDCLPFDPDTLRRRGLDGIRKIICDQTPPTPSTRARSAPDAARPAVPWRSALRGDLDAITLKALAKRREDRYASPAALAEDLGRWREGLPVAARPPLLGYVMSRYLARHWRAMTAAALVVVTVLAVAIYAFIKIDAARRTAESERTQKETERQRAETQRERAEENAARYRTENARAEFRLGRLAAQRGQWNEALAAFHRAEQAGFDQPVRLAIARVEALEGNQQVEQSKKVLKALAARSDLGANEARVRLMEGDLLADRLENPDDGLDKVKAALDSGDLEPVDEAYAHALLAYRVEEACAHCRTALRLDPYRRRANEMFGLLLLATGQHEEFGKFVRAFRALYPDDPTGVMLELAEHGLAGRQKESEALIRERDKVDSREVIGLYRGVEAGMALIAIMSKLAREPVTPPKISTELATLLWKANSKIKFIRSVGKKLERLAVAPALVHAYLPFDRMYKARGLLGVLRIFQDPDQFYPEGLGLFETASQRVDDALFLNLVAVGYHELANREKDTRNGTISAGAPSRSWTARSRPRSFIPRAPDHAAYFQPAWLTIRQLLACGLGRNRISRDRERAGKTAPSRRPWLILEKDETTCQKMGYELESLIIRVLCLRRAPPRRRARGPFAPRSARLGQGGWPDRVRVRGAWNA